MSEGTRSSARVEALLAEMSVEEKIGQLTQYFYFKLPEDADLSAVNPAMRQQPAMVEGLVAQGKIGALLFVKDPADISRLQKLTIEGNRHRVPALFGYDIIHGFRTIFPVPIGLAASWDAELIEAAQTVAAREARSVGLHWAFAPMVDIARDPRWGRIVEGAGEDPHLGSVVAAAQVRGFQGERVGTPGRLIAGPKHFLGYGAALGGRDYDEVDLSDQEIWNTYVPPFQAAIDAGAGNIMSAYMDLNGVPATGNRWLLTDVLRDALGFDGFVVSDAASVRDLYTHHFASDVTDAGVRALAAGVDLEMATFDAALGHLAAAIADGRVTEERLDVSVRRILNVKEQLGLFDDPYVDEEEAARILSDPAHREAARRAAEGAAVLLRNESRTLPFCADRLDRVAVFGPLADSRRDTIGPWVFDHDLDETVTVLDGIRAHLGDEVAVTFHSGIETPERPTPSIFDVWGDPSPTTPQGFDAEVALDEAVRAAVNADVAVVVVGEQQDMIGEQASRSDLTLPGDQQRLIEAIVATGTPVALVIMSGRPLDLGRAAETVPAILQIWYPGTQGGAAVARLLFGDAAPAGRLPFTWPRTVGQVPIHHAVTRSHDPAGQNSRYWDEESTPLFPFGHGLTYTTFEYRSIRVDSPVSRRDETITVTIEIANTGDRDGIETAQVYLHQRHGTSSRPLRQLKAFRRVEIAAGSTASVEFEIGPDQRRYWSAATRDWVLDETVFDIWAGPDATAELHAEFTVSDTPPAAE